MRISDWSSDVCSSDLRKAFVVPQQHIIGWPEALYELRLQQQRLRIGIRGDDRQAARLRHHALQALRQAGDLDVIGDAVLERSEARRVGTECVRTCRSRWSTYPEKKQFNMSDTWTAPYKR